MSIVIGVRSEMSLATRPTHANREHLEKAASDIGAGPERVVIADDCYRLTAEMHYPPSLCCCWCTYECTVTESPISHPAKRIDNAAKGKKHWWQVGIFSLNGHTEYQAKPFMR